MNALHFTGVDLDANREGRLSDAQRKRLDAEVETIRKYNRYVIPVFALGVVLLLCFGLTPDSSATQDETWLSSRLRDGNLLLVGIMLGICFGVTLVWNWWSLRRYEQGQVRIVEGTAQVISRYSYAHGARRLLYQVRIRRSWFRGMTFRFQDAESLRHFKTGQSYRVYYLSYYALPQALSTEDVTEEKQ